MSTRWQRPVRTRDFCSKNDQNPQLGKILQRSRHWLFSTIWIAKKVYKTFFRTLTLSERGIAFFVGTDSWFNFSIFTVNAIVIYENRSSKIYFVCLNNSKIIKNFSQNRFKKSLDSRVHSDNVVKWLKILIYPEIFVH